MKYLLSIETDLSYKDINRIINLSNKLLNINIKYEGTINENDRSLINCHNVLNNIIQIQRKEKIDNIFRDVLKVDIELLKTHTRKLEVSWMRHLYAYYLYTYVGYTVIEVGRVLNRDHTTILGSLKKVNVYNPPLIYSTSKKIVDDTLKEESSNV